MATALAAAKSVAAVAMDRNTITDKMGDSGSSLLFTSCMSRCVALLLYRSSGTLI